MKKILFVINSLGLGGAEKSITSLLNTVDYSKYNVSLLMFNPSGMFIKLLPSEVRVLPQPKYLKQLKTPLIKQFLHPRFLLARLSTSIALKVNSHKKALHPAQCFWKHSHFVFDRLPDTYDAAIAWGQGNPTHYVAEKVSARNKIAFINVNYEAAGHNKEFDRQYYAEYDHIVNVSDELNTLTKSVFPEFSSKMQTIYDINNANMINRMAELSNPFIYETEKPILVTVGRITYQKGYDFAVKAAKILKDRGFHFKWFFVGDGPSRHEIEELIAKNEVIDCVILVGAQDNPYIYMKHADIYIQSSRFEGYCLTLAEARIVNTPVISTDFDVVYNQLTHEQNGLIVSMDPCAIADAIYRMWIDNDLRNTIVSNIQKEKKGNTEEILKLYEMLG